VVEQNYTVREVTKPMNVVVSTMAKCVVQLKQERQSKLMQQSYSNDARPTQDP